MPTPAEQVALIISNAIAKADEYTTRTENAAEKLTDLFDATSRGYYLGTHWYTAEVKAVEPGVPDVENSVFTYEAQYEKLIARLSDELADFFVEYYPLDNDAFDDGVAWLKNTIGSGGVALSAEVEDRLWQKGRDRLVREGMRQTDTVVNGFAAKGYSFPPGLMAAQVHAINTETFGKMGDLAGTIAVKQAELYIDTLKFAVDLAVNTRLKAIAAAADYIKALMLSSDAAARIANLNSDAKAKMIAATADLYRARLTKDQLLLNAHAAKQATDTQWQSSVNMDHHHKDMDERIRVLTGAAALYADTAKAALSSLSAIASQSVVSL